MLRIERTLATLKGAMIENIFEQDQIFVATGDFKTPKEAKAANQEEQLLPWRFSEKDSRFFINWSMELPEFDQNYEYLIAISTGREGEWDAVNPQFLAFVNDEVVCGLDTNHRTIYLHPSLSEKRADFGCHFYTGMAAGDLWIRIVLTKRNKSIVKAYYDLKVLAEVLNALPEDNTSRIELKTKVERAINSVRFGPGKNELLTGCRSLSKILEETCYGMEGTLPYSVYAIGHTHIDVAWLWDLRQTAEKVARSYSTALDLQSRYPAYKFMASQPALYEMLEAGHADIFEKIKASTRSKLWESEGAMYLEADCNLTGGEALIRQIESGQEYFKTKFGSVSRCLWLPDVFGYSAALPQILKSFGIELFVTSKISWNDTNKLPVDSFIWEGIDGSTIPTQFITTMSMETLNKGEFKTRYGGSLAPSEMLGCALRHQQREIQPNCIMPYGFGDGGGGATEEMLETAARLTKGVKGMPKLVMAHVSDFIEAYRETPEEQLPTWVGELYLEYHRGTYTTNGGIKKRHRQLEDLLIKVEKYHAMKKLIGSKENPASLTDELYQPWKMLLLNEFHDILPGSSIEKVYQDAYEQLDKAIEEAQRVFEREVGVKSVAGENYVTIVNTLEGDFTGPIFIEEATITDKLEAAESYELVIEGNLQSNKIPMQYIKEGLWISDIPRQLKIKGLSSIKARIEKVESAQNSIERALMPGETVETSNYQIAFDDLGNMTKLTDLAQTRELLKGKGLRFTAYEDRPMRWDAWDIDEDYVKYPLEWSKNADFSVFDGEVAKVVNITRHIGKSIVKEQVLLYRNEDSRRIDFICSADWQEHQVLLRSEGEFDLHAPFATYDVQFGHVHRPVDKNHSYNKAKFEVCAQHWADLSEGNYGVMLMSNDKFGYNAHGSSLGMSLIKSPTWPNPNSDQGSHEFRFAYLPISGEVNYAKRHEEGLKFCQSPVVFAGASEVDINDECLLTLPENIKLEAMRVIQDGEIEIRLCERGNSRGKFALRLPEGVASCFKTDLRGETLCECKSSKDGFEVEYKPFEIITLRVK